MNMFFPGFYKHPCNNNTVFLQFLSAYGAYPFYPVVWRVAVGAPVDFHHVVWASLEQY